jgi:hypothetical protein
MTPHITCALVYCSICKLISSPVIFVLTEHTQLASSSCSTAVFKKNELLHLPSYQQHAVLVDGVAQQGDGVSVLNASVDTAIVLVLILLCAQLLSNVQLAVYTCTYKQDSLAVRNKP